MDYAVITRKGNREINEDSVGVFEKDGQFCLIVADGLGGHGKGEVASALAVETCEAVFKSQGKADEFWPEFFETCEEALEKRQKEEGMQNDMKTTVVSALVCDDKMQWAHVGDSRLYWFRKRRPVKRTIDHSVPQVLVLAKEIKEKDIRNHPDRNRLLRVMGQKQEKIFYEVSEWVKIKRNDALLLCSDGFWEYIDEKQMQATLKKSQNAKEWLQLMEEIVVQNGSTKEMDNYSAIAVIWG